MSRRRTARAIRDIPTWITKVEKASIFTNQNTFELITVIFVKYETISSNGLTDNLNRQDSLYIKTALDRFPIIKNIEYSG